jgi:hypothetical protein
MPKFTYTVTFEATDKDDAARLFEQLDKVVEASNRNNERIWGEAKKVSAVP